MISKLRVRVLAIIAAPGLGPKKATQRRMKTVMQNLIYLYIRQTRRARQLIMRVACSGPWFEGVVPPMHVCKLDVVTGKSECEAFRSIIQHFSGEFFHLKPVNAHPNRLGSISIRIQVLLTKLNDCI